MSDHAHPVDADRVRQAHARIPMAAEAGALAAQLSLLADPTRLRVLLALRVVPELCVGDLALALEVTEDTTGYALRLLRTAGLVEFRKEGRVVFYRLAGGFPEPLLDHCVVQLATLLGSVTPGAGDEP